MVVFDKVVVVSGMVEFWVFDMVASWDVVLDMEEDLGMEMGMHKGVATRMEAVTHTAMVIHKVAEMDRGVVTHMVAAMVSTVLMILCLNKI